MSEKSLRRMMLAVSIVLALVNSVYAEEVNIDQAARITLACLLGGVPAVALLMALVICVYIRERKKQLRKHALANGIELDEEGWPVHHTRVPLTTIKRPQRETRSYSSSAGNFKGPSLDTSQSYSSRQDRESIPVGPSHLSPPQSSKHRPPASSGTL